MENQRFDNLSRLMASGASRRTVLRGVFGGALAGLGLRAGAAAPMDKVDVCHYDADAGAYHWITINGNALDAHLAHGDFIDCEGNFVPDESCTCVCDVDSLGCTDPFVPDTDSCTCVCPPCDPGYVADTETCACVRDFSAYTCDAFNVSSPSCGTGNGGFCVTNVEQAGLVCIGAAGCIPCDTGGCADGWVCVSDGSCGGNHCHPLYA